MECAFPRLGYSDSSEHASQFLEIIRYLLCILSIIGVLGLCHLSTLGILYIYIEERFPTQHPASVFDSAVQSCPWPETIIEAFELTLPRE